MVAGSLLLATTACGGSPQASSPHAGASSVADLGAVPIPTAPKGEQTSTSTPGHPALLAVGGPVRARLVSGASTLVTVLGPVQSTTTPGAKATDGTFTIRLAPTHGTVRASAGELSSRDETGHPVHLRPVGPSSVVARPGHPAVLRVVGRYSSGAAQVSWRSAGKLVALWDFNIELD